MGSIYVEPAPVITGLEPIRVNSTMATRNYKRLGTNKHIDVSLPSQPKNFRKLHTSLGHVKPERKTVYPEISVETSQILKNKPLSPPVA